MCYPYQWWNTYLHKLVLLAVFMQAANGIRLATAQHDGSRTPRPTVPSCCAVVVRLYGLYLDRPAAAATLKRVHWHERCWKPETFVRQRSVIVSACKTTCWAWCMLSMMKSLIFTKNKHPHLVTISEKPPTHKINAAKTLIQKMGAVIMLIIFAFACMMSRVM